jgi:rare lipoprotein A
MRSLACCVCVMVVFGGCSTPQEQPSPAEPATRVLESREGLASYVASALHGKTTASGAPFDGKALVAAHPTYPFGTLVRVTNLANARAIEALIVDRGPVLEARREGVVIDVSREAAEQLRFVDEGRTKVRVEVLRWGR